MNMIDVTAAREAPGLRLVLLTDFPSPWSVAAKAIFDIKGIPYSVVRYRASDERLREWTGAHNAPVAIIDDRPPLSAWSDILALSEALEGACSLVPESCHDRISFFGMAHLLLGPQGFAWQTRLLILDVSLASGGRLGFPRPVAQYLAAKYGYTAQRARAARRIMDDISRLFADCLHQARRRGSPYLLGSGLTALDIYLATSVSVLSVFEDPSNPLPIRSRSWLESAATELQWQIPPLVLEHRDFVYRNHILRQAQAAPSRAATVTSGDARSG